VVRPERSTQLLMLGDTIDAGAAEQIGLTSELVWL
jgi:enoyl-CoA hydratase/carnithine racemase